MREGRSMPLIDQARTEGASPRPWGFLMFTERSIGRGWAWPPYNSYQ
nr:MAG TPA: hypothetical protein [Caudoviricetes sp.]